MLLAANVSSVYLVLLSMYLMLFSLFDHYSSAMTMHLCKFFATFKLAKLCPKIIPFIQTLYCNYQQYIFEPIWLLQILQVLASKNCSFFPQHQPSLKSTSYFLKKSYYRFTHWMLSSHFMKRSKTGSKDDILPIVVVSVGTSEAGSFLVMGLERCG